MTIDNALLSLSRLQFPFQKGELFLKFSPEVQEALLLKDDLDRTFFILFKPIFLKLSKKQKLLLASHPKCDPDLLLLILNDGESLEDKAIKLALAKNPNLPINGQKILGLDMDDEVRLLLAQNKSLHEDVLRAIKKPLGYLEMSQELAERVDRLTYEEILKTYPEEIQQKKIQFLADFKKPSWGRLIYVVDSSGRLHLLAADRDSSG